MMKIAKDGVGMNSRENWFTKMKSNMTSKTDSERKREVGRAERRKKGI